MYTDGARYDDAEWHEMNKRVAARTCGVIIAIKAVKTFWR